MQVTTQKESKEFNSKLFQAVARTIASRWKNMKVEHKKTYEDRASAEMDKYRQAVEEYERKMVESSTIGKRQKAESASSVTATTNTAQANDNLEDAPLGSEGGNPREVPMSQTSPFRFGDALKSDSRLHPRGPLGGQGNPSSSATGALGQQAHAFWGAGGGGYAGNFSGQGLPTGLPLNQMPYHTDRLVLPGRNALLDAFTLRQLEEQQQLRRQAVLAQAFAAEQQVQQQQQQQQLADLQATLAQRQQLELLSARSTSADTVPPYALTQETLLERVLREQGHAQMGAQRVTTVPSLTGSVAGLGGQQSTQAQHLPSHAAPNVDPLLGREPSDRTAAAAASALANATGMAPNLSLAGMSAEELAAVVRFMEGQNRRRQT